MSQILQVHTDNDISTKFFWKRPSMLSPESTATIQWNIPEGTQPGQYRLRHFGDYKHILGGTEPFSGASRSFEVTQGGRFASAKRLMSAWSSRLHRQIFGLIS